MLIRRLNRLCVGNSSLHSSRAKQRESLPRVTSGFAHRWLFKDSAHGHLSLISWRPHCCQFASSAGASGDGQGGGAAAPKRGDATSNDKTRLPQDSSAKDPQPAGRSFDIFEVIYNCGAVVGLASFVVTDMLYLRVLQICSGLMSLSYHSTRKPPLRSPIMWTCMFMGVNAVNLVRLLLENRPASLTEDEVSVYESIFHGFGVKPREIQKLFRCAEWREYDLGDVLWREGDAADKVILVIKGGVYLGKDTSRHELYCDFLSDTKQVRRSMWFGVMEFVGESWEARGASEEDVHNRRCKSTITVAEKCRALIWSSSDLSSLMSSDARLGEHIQQMWSCSLVDKVNDMMEQEQVSNYTLALGLVVADGYVAPPEKEALKLYRKQEQITDAVHEDALRSLGWTTEEFYNGVKSGAGDPVKIVLERLKLAQN